MTLTLHKSQVHFLVSGNNEIAVRSCPLFCLQRKFRNLLADCSIVGLYCVTVPWQ